MIINLRYAVGKLILIIAPYANNIDQGKLTDITRLAK